MIPIYRAKKIDSDEYVESSGIINEHNEIRLYKIYVNDMNVWHEIDPSTLAIHFPDMLDSEGTKIFASLSEDGKGGDKLFEDKFFNVEFVSIQAKRVYLKRKTGESFLYAPKYLDCYRKKDLKVTGIQE